MYRIPTSFILLSLVIFSCSQNQPAENKPGDQPPPLPVLASTPPMGWNSWNCLGIEATEEQVKAVADYMADNLLEFGWEYVVIDAGWYHPPEFATADWTSVTDPLQAIDRHGRLIPDTIKFPSAGNGAGFKPLADYIHEKGLKFGIHIMRGIPWNAVREKTPVLGTEYTADQVAEPNNVCEWAHVTEGIDMTHPGGAAYYRSIVELYESWGVDYIKADDMSRPYRVDEIHGLSRALRSADRDIVLSLSPGGAPLAAANDLREQAHLWRISGDFWDSWESLRNMFHLCRIWAPYITENHWPDADMLPVGKLRKNGVGEWEAGHFDATSEEVTDEYSRFTEDEQYTLMNLWAMCRSPLMMGGYLPENDEFTLSLLTNEDLLEINRHSTRNHVVHQDEATAVWAAESGDGKIHYLAVFNLTDYHLSSQIDLQTLGLDGNAEYILENIWTKTERTGKATVPYSLEPHASVLYSIHESP